MALKIFPKKVFVTFTMASGAKHVMVCDQFEFDFTKGLTEYTGAMYSHCIPGKNMALNTSQVESVTYKTRRLWRICKG